MTKRIAGRSLLANNERCRDGLAIHLANFEAYRKLTKIHDDMSLNSTPPDIRQEANETYDTLLPSKSKSKYETCYKKFMDWTLVNGIKNISENVLIAYMKKLSCDIKPSTLWTTYSMLKTMINIKNNIDISIYPKLRSFLKLKSTGYKTKKSKILTPEQIKHFLLKAPNREYLFTKKSGNNLTLTLIEKRLGNKNFKVLVVKRVVEKIYCTTRADCPYRTQTIEHSAYGVVLNSRYQSLLFVHAFSGYNTSEFFGKGKMQTVKLLNSRRDLKMSSLRKTFRGKDDPGAIQSVPKSFNKLVIIIVSKLDNAAYAIKWCNAVKRFLSPSHYKEGKQHVCLDVTNDTVDSTILRTKINIQ
ncbi:hypothetical protein NQ317_009463 [Molorchus minor]|uniref:Uncharacterized protein n=1 Tax=Molorchus minor TaxID=1323400 RepID=A0ABQ9JML3_9CUCU|nr:hypothetical protein NQ317_009463 [Molorchus minor]